MWYRGFLSALFQSHSAGDLTGTEASGADVHVGRSTIHDCLHPLDIGLPGAVGAAMRVGNLDAENDVLVAEFTFGHVAYLLAMTRRIIRRRVAFYEASNDILADSEHNCKCFFQFEIGFLREEGKEGSSPEKSRQARGGEN